MFKVVKAHFRKQWLSFLTVVLFVLIASMMMAAGVTIAAQSKHYYIDKAAEQNLADYMIALYDSHAENGEIINKLAQHVIVSDSSVDEYEITSIIPLESDNYYYNVSPYNPDSKITNISGEIGDIRQDEIVLNLFAKIRLGIKVGDEIELHSPNVQGKFVVAGFYEELMEMYTAKIYMHEKVYQEYYNDISAYLKGIDDKDNPYWTDTLIKIKSSDKDFVNKMMAKATEIYAPLFTPGSGVGGYNVMSQDLASENIMSFASILSAVLIVFAFVILVVCIIIIRFSLVSFIEDDIKNTGILKGLGYANKDIRIILLIEYLISALAASILGALLSVFITPMFSTIISKSIDLIWKAVPSAPVIAASIILPVVIVALFVWLLSRKINKITPLNALRQGIETHSFKHNFLPLGRFDKCTNAVLSVKGVLNQALRYVSVGVVVLVISFVSVFAVILHYNLNVSNTAFAAMTGAESADALVRGGAIDNETLVQMDEIDRISYSGFGDSVKVLSGDNSMYCGVSVVKDFSLSRVAVLYKGKNPVKANEIMIPKKVADYFNVNIGDTLFCSDGKNQNEFLVTGLCQNMSFPMNLYICGEGVEPMYGVPAEEYDYYNAYIYLKNGVDYDAFIAKLRDMNTKSIDSIADREECANVYITPSIKDGAMLLTIAMDVITAICVCMVLLFILRLKIIRERKIIAINKALGATTRDIVIQMTLGIVCVIGIFALIGGLLGAALTGVMLKLALSSFSIMSIRLAVPWGIVFAMIICITAFSYGVAALIALRTRRITPRSLISGN